MAEYDKTINQTEAAFIKAFTAFTFIVANVLRLWKHHNHWLND